MKIVTLTLNPAFDVHCHTANFQPYHENLAQITSNDAGGKGVNISRALTVNGIENTALVVLGAENGDSFRRALQADEIPYCEITVAGSIRENITLHTDNAPETRISFAGFSTDESLLTETDAIIGEDLSDAIITFTGRVPNGISMDAVKAFLKHLQAKGARIVLDSKSFSAQDMLEVSPWLIKPNEEEIALYTDKPIQTVSDAARAIVALQEAGIEQVLLSLGKSGALLASQAGVWKACAPKIDVLSTIGAGDSSIAGFLAAHRTGAPLQDCLATAVAFGSAACLREGTAPPLAEDIARLQAEINVEEFVY